MNVRRLTAAVFLLVALVQPAASFAAPSFLGAPAFDALAPNGSVGSFHVPPRLRGRVDFWKDVFTRYGKMQQVIHHREFPQVRFGVIDYSSVAEGMNPVEFERFKQAEGTRRVKEVHAALLSLADGNAPKTLLEDIVQREMRKIPGGSEKYRRAVQEDLVRTQTGIKERYRDAVQRSGRYISIMEDIFTREYGLPAELTRVPFIESSFDYTAYSSVGAAGIWQFMPKTAKRYKMTVNSLVDERRDPIEATRGAAQYMIDAYKSLESWPLAITSYNHGVAGVWKKVKTYGTSDIVELIEHPAEQPFGFASSNFYPEFLAAVEIYRDWRKYFPDLELDPPVKVTYRKLPSAVPVQVLARDIGVDTSTLRLVNCALADSIWRGRSKVPAGYSLRIPHGIDPQRLASLTESLQNQPQPIGPAASSVYGGVVHKVRPGETLAAIGKRYNVSVSQIQKLNSLNAGVIRPGQNLVIKEPSSVASAGRVSGKKAPANLPVKAPSTKSSSTSRGGIRYTVRKGDTLGAIARRFNVSVDALKKANKISSNSISINQNLQIP